MKTFAIILLDGEVTGEGQHQNINLSFFVSHLLTTSYKWR